MWRPPRRAACSALHPLVSALMTAVALSLSLLLEAMQRLLWVILGHLCSALQERRKRRILAGLCR